MIQSVLLWAFAFGHRLMWNKTFIVVALFVLEAANRWNENQLTGAQFFQVCQIGVIGILIRASIAKLSGNVAAAASPPPGVVGLVEKGRPMSAVSALALGFMCLGAVSLTGCEYAKGASGKICFQDEKGTQICIPVNQPPPPAPAQIQPLPADTAPGYAATQLTVKPSQPLEK